MAQMILSVTGSDRPGLTKALAAAVVSAGGNWLESHLSRLGGLYVGSVLVDVDDTNLDRLRAAIAEVDAQGLQVRLTPAQAGAATTHGEALTFTVVGQDRPGIVSQVTSALSVLGANIETFQTRITAAPESGEPLFNLQASLRLPHGLKPGEVQEALEDISAEVMVDVTVTAAG